MTYDAIERSNYDGAPSLLYEFSVGDTTWRYTDNASNIVLNSTTYTSIAITNEGFTQSGSPTNDDLSVTIAAFAPVTGIYAGTPPSEPVALRIRRKHRDSTEAPVIWSGTVKSGAFISAAEFRFNCNSLLSTLNRNGLRLFWSRGCPHTLYDHGCSLNADDYGIAVQIESMTGASVTSSALNTLGDDWLSAGFLSFLGPYGSMERRAIERHAGDTMWMLGTTDGMAVDQWIVVYPGCDRTSLTCDEKFANLANYGGFPHLPSKSPFDGDPVF